MVLSEKDGVGWKLLVTCWAFMECLLFGGIAFGWGPLNFVLKSEGIYADLCPHAVRVNSTQWHTADESQSETRQTSVRCKEQDSRMALCFTIASALFAIGCVIQGQIIYKYGTRVGRIIMFLIAIAGKLMIAFISKENPWLMFPGLSCLAIGGIPLLVTNCQVAHLFAKRNSTVVGLLNGASDTSSSVMLLVKIASDNGFSRQNMFFLITAIYSMVLVSTFFFLPKYFIMKQQATLTIVVVAEDVETSCQLELEENETAKVDTTMASLPSLSCCVRNPMFLTHTAWLSLIQLRYWYFIGTLNPYLERTFDGDEAKVSYFTNMCYFIMFGGLVTSILSGSVYDWQKALLKDGKTERYRRVAPAAVPQGIASLLAVIVSILVLIPNSNLLYITFITVTVKRSFLYTLSTAFISEMFPEQYFGILYGIVVICGGMFGFIQYAFFTWAESYENGAMHVEIVLLCMMCVSFIHPLYLWISSWNEERKYKDNK